MQTNKMMHRLISFLGVMFLLVASVVFGEVKMYTGVGTCALGDIGTPEQAKNFAREKALQNAQRLPNCTRILPDCGTISVCFINSR